MEDNILCCGCLCAGRKMVILDEYWRKQCFLQIVNEIPMSPPIDATLSLCWECAAQVTRFTAFKKQVKHCYRMLNEYVQQNLNTSELPQPPRLLAQRVLELSLHPDVEEEGAIIVEALKVEPEPMELKNQIKEEDNASVYSDNLEDDQALIEFKIAKKKNKKEKKKKKKKDPQVDPISVVELTDAQVEAERRARAADEAYASAMFRCARCVVSFPNEHARAEHARARHEANALGFVCRVCSCSFARAVSLSQHAARHRRRYRCGACGDTFPARRPAQTHYRLAHAPPVIEYPIEAAPGNGNTKESQDSKEGIKQEAALFPCEFCEKTFRWKTSLRKHVETHRIESGQKRKPYCESCRLSFTTTSNLQKHVKTSSKHQIQLKLRKIADSNPTDLEKQQVDIEQIKKAVNSARQKYPCAQCGKRFQWRGNLLRHLRSHNARAAGSLVCAPCNRTFSSLATYTQHMRVSRKHVSEEDFKYMCSDCGKKFANKTRLRDHVDWEHLKNYVHTCDVCKKVFKSHTSLYLHKQVVHRKDNADHLCDHCGKHFPNQAKLRAHIAAAHGGGAPYKCSVCCARFSWHSCLARHARRLHKDRAAQGDA